MLIYGRGEPIVGDSGYHQTEENGMFRSKWALYVRRGRDGGYMGPRR